ncbi:MAG: anhydro-N-acetylmuramic acid kinase [Pelagibacteraceae bacterium]
MEKKEFVSIGLMSGTSMDGVDASIIKSNGNDQLVNILDRYYEFNKEIYEKLVNLRNLIIQKEDLDKYSKEIEILDRELTLFHGKIVNQIIKEIDLTVNLIGFHGQTIYHNPKNLISKQLGNGQLLSQLTNTDVIYDFRQNDLKHGGQGAPLTPIFHNLISSLIGIKHNINCPINILNIGGISNLTKTVKSSEIDLIKGFDIGPGNCLIDEWIRNNSSYRYDEFGNIGKSGSVNELILNQAIDNFTTSSYSNSLDIKDFDTSFVRGLSLEDGCATLTKFTAHLIANGIKYCHQSNNQIQEIYLMCGGGRKNNFLINCIKQELLNQKNITIDIIDNYNFNGDFIESQAFGYLAIRSYLNLPISFPGTTGCKNKVTGGILAKNY